MVANAFVLFLNYLRFPPPILTRDQVADWEKANKQDVLSGIGWMEGDGTDESIVDVRGALLCMFGAVLEFLGDNVHLEETAKSLGEGLISTMPPALRKTRLAKFFNKLSERSTKLVVCVLVFCVLIAFPWGVDTVEGDAKVSRELTSSFFNSDCVELANWIDELLVEVPEEAEGLAAPVPEGRELRELRQDVLALKEENRELRRDLDALKKDLGELRTVDAAARAEIKSIAQHLEAMRAFLYSLLN